MKVDAIFLLCHPSTHGQKKRYTKKNFEKVDTKERAVMVPLFCSPARIILLSHTQMNANERHVTYPNRAHSNGLKHATDGLYLYDSKKDNNRSSY